MLKLNQITKKYGRQSALKEVSLWIEAPGLVMLYGANGSGKSTLLKIISAIVYKSSGSLEVRGIVSYFPDKALLPRLMAVKSYIQYIFKLYGVTQKPIEAMEAHGIPNKRIGELSKGNLQKLMLLQAFSVPAQIYVLDEPLDGLDDLAKKRFRDEIQAAVDRGAAVIMSLHRNKLYAELSPRSLELKNGECYEKKKKL